MPPKAAARAKPTKSAKPAMQRRAEVLPFARVSVEVSLPHLDRTFDYLVSQEQDAAAQPGVRVRVRFAGALVGGFILERAADTDHDGKLSFLERVLGAEPVLQPDVAAVAREVADRWAGSLADVTRLAVPPRHATAERTRSKPADTQVKVPPPSALGRYTGGPELLRELAAGTARRVWTALPGEWPAEIAAAAAAVLAAGRGVVIVVPDARDVERMDRALTVALGAGHHVALTAELGPEERYGRFLSVSRGAVQAVVGTRAAVWAPVRELGLMVVWDDGDDLLAEPRAPYCHARDVAVLRAHRAGASMLLAGHAVTAEGAQLLSTGWASELSPTAPARTRDLPAIRASGGDDELADDEAARAARLPTIGWRTAKDALQSGPVLVQVPRQGYVPAVACASCRRTAQCKNCAGPLSRMGEDAPPVCRWCGLPATGWRCPHCASLTLRAVVVGARRTAEELGRVFPGYPVKTSGGGKVLARITEQPALVVATPGAEPIAAGGYAAAILLDGWLMLSRPDLRSGEEALRRWLNAASLVRGSGDGGRVIVVAPGELRPVQALLRWQPRWHAERELEDRRALHLPPAGRMASLTGTAEAVAELLGSAKLPPAAEILGPVAAIDGEPDDERVLLRVPRVRGQELAAALKAAQATRSARKAAGSVRVEMDPIRLG
ncbi:MAG TPA: primosomal protein N' [Mycobacteriales bacterium]|nr:primosomal protein N' [Mycobacteriales bacterium]